MKTIRGFIFASIAFLGVSAIPAQAGGHWGVGINIGFPVYRPWYPCYGYGWYYPPPYYYAPVVIQQPVAVQPVAVQPAPAQPAPAAQPNYSAPAPVHAPTPVTTAHLQPVNSQQSEINQHLNQLANSNEEMRKDSALQLGRLRAQEAIDPLAAVREAAARGLALIGSSKALPALEQAARADVDPTVRHSAEFSIDVIRTR
jgi:hypothetical protein